MGVQNIYNIDAGGGSLGVTVDLTSEVVGVLPVENGGTEVATLADNALLVGSDAAAITTLAVGTTGQLLVGASSADPAWATNINLPGTLDVTGLVTLDDDLTVSGGDLVLGTLNDVIGTIKLHASAAGFGGRMQIYNDTGQQTNTEYWIFGGNTSAEDFIFQSFESGLTTIYIVDGTTYLTTFANDLTVSGDVIVSTDLTVSGDATFVGAVVHPFITFTADDTTPDVSAGNIFFTGALWTGGNDITDFNGGTQGQQITIVGGDTDCNVVDGAGKIELISGTTWNAAVGATLVLLRVITAWREQYRSAT